MIGRFNPNYLMGFTGRTWQNLPEFNPKLVSEYAVKVYGSGHVVAYNSIANFTMAWTSRPTATPTARPIPIRDRLPVSIDFYGNDIFNVEDNCIEADGGAHNIRIFRNRCFNHGHRALSVQPAFGGPVYFIRNIVYHAPEGGAVKFTASSAGIVVYHNTLIAPVKPMLLAASNVHYRNNLDSRKERDARDLRGRDEHQLLDVGLQRLPSERGRGIFVRVELAADVDAREFSRRSREALDAAASAPRSEGARGRRFKTLRNTRRDRSGRAQRPGRLRRLREGRPPGPDPRTLYKPADFDFQLGPARPPSMPAYAAGDQRRFHRPRAGPRRAMKLVARFRTTAPGNKPRIERI